MEASEAPARGRNGSGERGDEDQALTRILVVEDDEFMAAALVSMLQTIAETNTASGAELCLQVPCIALLCPCLCVRCTHKSTRASQVEHTSTGESAWDLLSSRRYDIALVDVKLPGITGLDLSWCYESSFSEGVAVHATIMIACTSEIDPAALYEPATPVTRRQRPCLTGPAWRAACLLSAAPQPAARRRPFCAPAVCGASASSSVHVPLSRRRHGLKDVLKKPVTMASLRHMLHKWMPRRNASSFKLQSYPTPLGRGIKSGSGIFSARILLVEDCEVRRGG